MTSSSDFYLSTGRLCLQILIHRLSSLVGHLDEQTPPESVHRLSSLGLVVYPITHTSRPSTIKTFPSSHKKICESAQSMSNPGLVTYDWLVA